MRDALVTIVVPCYNQAQYLSEALDSVLAQSYQYWECVIVNDGSPDNTAEIARQYVNQDIRFKYLEQPNRGLSSARNAGIRAGSGKYILPLDADDKISSEYLKAAVAALETDETLNLVYCRAEFFGKKSGEWRHNDYTPANLLIRNLIFCSAVFRRADFDRAGGYDESFMHGHEDWDLWISILLPEGKVLRLEEVHFFYRVRRASMAHGMSREHTIANGLKIYEKHRDIYTRFLGHPQQWLAENQLLREDWNALMNPRLKLANFLFIPVDLLRRLLGKKCNTVFTTKYTK
jgi:glycosyltransferase involved in cell wall biosynthesis